MLGKLRRTPHPSPLERAVQLLHRLHLCELRPGTYFSTVIDVATRFTSLALLRFTRDAAAQVCQTIPWFDSQTDSRVQRVRHNRGGENMGGF